MTATLATALEQPAPARSGLARASLAALQARYGYRPCDDSATPAVVRFASIAATTWRLISGRGASAMYEITEEGES